MPVQPPPLRPPVLARRLCAFLFALLHALAAAAPDAASKPGLPWLADGAAAAIEAAIRGGKTRTVTLRTPVPVVLFYATAVAERDGRILFAEDIYGRDGPLLEALARP